MKSDVIIVGSGVAGLFAALTLPEHIKITLLTKGAATESDSFLAQGGICVKRDEQDYNAFYEDTMRAGHYENDPRSVEIMINSSTGVIERLVKYGVRFQKNGDEFVYTREGAHSRPRILFHKDQTGKEITSTLLRQVMALPNVTVIENCRVVDIITKNGVCFGVIAVDGKGNYSSYLAGHTLLATGGIGGLFKHSTNFPHLTGDALAIALKHNIRLKNVDYIQIHPTTLYSKEKGREFLISESVRGEGAVLLNQRGERFVNELLPRDVVTAAIYDQMKSEGSSFVRLSLAPIPREKIISHFPNIYHHCLEQGIDITKEPIPVVPAQHYFMGGIWVDENSKTSMDRLYAIGETSCNGVHGKNRLASNSLLESLVFAARAAVNTLSDPPIDLPPPPVINPDDYKNVEQEYKSLVLAEIEKEKRKNG